MYIVLKQYKDMKFRVARSSLKFKLPKKYNVKNDPYTTANKYPQSLEYWELSLQQIVTSAMEGFVTQVLNSNNDLLLWEFFKWVSWHKWVW